MSVACTLLQCSGWNRRYFSVGGSVINFLLFVYCCVAVTMSNIRCIYNNNDTTTTTTATAASVAATTTTTTTTTNTSTTGHFSGTVSHRQR